MKQIGFTIVELITTVAIILIITAVTWSMLYRSIPHNQLAGASQEIVSALKDAQSSAVKSQNKFLVRFDINNKKYFVFEIVNNVEQSRGETALPNKVLFSAVNLTDNQVIFNSTGVPDYPGSLRLTNSLSEIKTIQINSSGLIYIE